MARQDSDTFFHVTKTGVQAAQVTESHLKSLEKVIEEGYEAEEDIVALRKMAAAKYILTFHKIITADLKTSMLIVLDDIGDVIDEYSRLITYFVNNNRELRRLLKEVEERMQTALDFFVDLMSAFTADSRTNCINDEFNDRVITFLDSPIPNVDVNVELVDYYKQVVAFYAYYINFCQVEIKRDNVSFMAQIALMTSACLIIHCSAMAGVHLPFVNKYEDRARFLKAISD